jgi:membrane associated rhomboid family serine protease
LILLHRRDASRFGQSGRVRIFLWVILAVGIGASLLPGVSMAGHAGGLVTGLLAGWRVPLLPHSAEADAAERPE